MKIFCVGRNYVEHAKELKNDIPEEPVIFIKPKTALVQNGVPFYYPEFTNELHYEAELVLRVSKNGRHILPKNAFRYFDAITVGIDFTARDIQSELKKKGLPWEKAKAWDSSTIIGAWQPADKYDFKQGIRFSMTMNGNTVQQGNSNDMLFNVPDIIANISQYFSLNIGDLIFTGTPAGVGECVVGDAFAGYLETQKVFDLTVK
ncbi:MAG: fumarylacetoacetate hydrolase family protein [Chitinophagaceae bacterium]